jgi:hypothetical protein
LTDAEMATVLERVEAEGGAAGFITMWDVILTEAEGVTYAEAVEQDTKFDVFAYAIPYEQSEQLTAAMRRARKRRHGASPARWRQQVTWTWFQIGPATFDHPWDT